MATYPEEAELETEFPGTTFYDYEFAQPCFKVSITDLGAQFLPSLFSLVFIVGLLGNITVIVVLTKYQKLKIMTNIYLLNLAISDLLFLFTLPFWTYYVHWNKWVFGHFMCKIISGLYYVGLFSEIFFIILLTIDRYLAIVHAVFALRTRTVTFGIITSVITWVLAVLAALPEFMFYGTQGHFEVLFCGPSYPEKKEHHWKRFQALRMNIFGLALPLLIMIICYTGIIKTLLRCPSKKKYKAIRLIFVIMVVFFVFWTPYNLLLLFSAFDLSFLDDCERSKQLDMAKHVTEVIAHTHCCINPIIYAFVGERFQKYLRHFLHRNVTMHLSKYIPFFTSEKLERSSSISPSSGDPELSVVF
ncbi:C-C chemokine receptor type 3 isoform X2 [Cavia porcellus]|uniref:C-C chemokine receptor type 3 n=2 Tax=Cavia porcellus TaxID=10141 RepID=CCR3_CAVPO|nr:C-C chemokine receptor type 3 [Cavia porcellus]Q9Z2I3.1 RecName: Full=C-C chemokine receptor type 3; Short=C-C CKR-3; Short=CC-CKR-3; Short=CCR-3; Short=CCR3; Short=CKR3; AltName: CD_antigen=CD193 [Cavia porcellus]AAC80428.1 C-C chemokine receptor 3 [Cavia porcellus]